MEPSCSHGMADRLVDVQRLGLNSRLVSSAELVGASRVLEVTQRLLFDQVLEVQCHRARGMYEFKDLVAVPGNSAGSASMLFNGAV